METTMSIIQGTKEHTREEAHLRSHSRRDGRSQEFRSYARESQEIADRWPGLIKQQYEALARQWLMLAERARHYEEGSDLSVRRSERR
jgi:hypothetical protein